MNISSCVDSSNFYLGIFLREINAHNYFTYLVNSLQEHHTLDALYKQLTCPHVNPTQEMLDLLFFTNHLGDTFMAQCFGFTVRCDTA